MKWGHELGSGLNIQQTASLVTRGKFRWLLVVPLAAVVLAAIGFLTEDRGPTYQGRTVIRWTEEPAAKIPADVINAFGPEAAPYLLSAWQREPTAFNRAAWAIWRKLPVSLHSRLWRYAPVDVADSSRRASEKGSVLSIDTTRGSDTLGSHGPEITRGV